MANANWSQWNVNQLVCLAMSFNILTWMHFLSIELSLNLSHWSFWSIENKIKTLFFNNIRIPVLYGTAFIWRPIQIEERMCMTKIEPYRSLFLVCLGSLKPLISANVIENFKIPMVHSEYVVGGCAEKLQSYFGNLFRYISQLSPLRWNTTNNMNTQESCVLAL